MEKLQQQLKRLLQLGRLQGVTLADSETLMEYQERAKAGSLQQRGGTQVSGRLRSFEKTFLVLLDVKHFVTN